jgi:hypothetical protein
MDEFTLHFPIVRLGKGDDRNGPDLASIIMPENSKEWQGSIRNLSQLIKKKREPEGVRRLFPHPPIDPSYLD